MTEPTTRKVSVLTTVSDLQTGDKLVGERTSGTTVLIPYTSPTGVSDGDKGDITVTSTGTVWTIDTPTVATVATDDKVLIKDTSAADVTRYVTAQSIADLAAGGVSSVNGETGAVTLTSDDISVVAQTNKFVTAADITKLGNLSGTNTGDQTSIVGITGTKAQFDTAVSDGNILYVGDITQYTDELAQDAVGVMVDASLTYVDATPLLQRAALTGDVTASAGSNATLITTPASATVATDDKVLIKDTSASDVMKYVTAQSIADLNANSIFKTVAVSGQSDVVADSITDTLTLAAGSNITLTTDAATDTITITAASGGTASSQAEQETASSTTTYVSPGRQQFHPSASKCWGNITTSGGTPTLQSSYNTTSITDSGVGLFTVTIANDFSSANYSINTGVNLTNSANSSFIIYYSQAAGSFILNTSNFGAAATDPTSCGYACFGDI